MAAIKDSLLTPGQLEAYAGLDEETRRLAQADKAWKAGVEYGLRMWP